MSIIAAAFALALAAAASETPAPDGVVATAPGGDQFVPEAPLVAAEPSDPPPHDLTTEEQIDRWLSSGREADIRRAEAEDMPLEPLPGYDRRTHVEAGVAVGSNGYQAYYGSMTAPLGDNAVISLSYSESKGGYERRER